MLTESYVVTVLGQRGSREEQSKSSRYNLIEFIFTAEAPVALQLCSTEGTVVVWFSGLMLLRILTLEVGMTQALGNLWITGLAIAVQFSMQVVLGNGVTFVMRRAVVFPIFREHEASRLQEQRSSVQFLIVVLASVPRVFTHARIVSTLIVTSPIILAPKGGCPFERGDWYK